MTTIFELRYFELFIDNAFSRSLYVNIHISSHYYQKPEGCLIIDNSNVINLLFLNAFRRKLVQCSKFRRFQEDDATQRRRVAGPFF